MLEFWFCHDSKYYRGDFEHDDRIVLYCAGGGRSALAADVLGDLGYTNVAHLTVGFNGWAEAGGAVADAPEAAEWTRTTAGSWSSVGTQSLEAAVVGRLAGVPHANPTS